MKNYLFSGLEPQDVLQCFYDLSQAVPRDQDNAGGISAFMEKFGLQLGLETFRDETDNVIIKKPAAPGYENCPVVMIEAHMDMILACFPGVKHDFYHEPIELLLEEDGNKICANGTTLGADCGIGAAFIMAVLKSENLPHPALEAVFTVNEETDMKGALKLHYEKLQSKIILSLDATRPSLGGAGEINAEIFLERAMTPFRDGDLSLELRIGGLIGGHSGKNAYAERGNANTLMARMLSYLKLEKQVPLRIASFVGGDTLATALARDAVCTITYPAQYERLVHHEVKRWDERFRSELEIPDPDVRLTAREPDEAPAETCDDRTTERFLDLMNILPDGIASRNKYFANKYESCSNVGVVEMKETSFRVIICIRSAVEAKKFYLYDKVRRLCGLMNLRERIMYSLPEWPYNGSSRLSEIIRPIYSDLESNFAQGTCEMGIFLANMPGCEAAGVGPVVHNPHSPNEYILVDEIADDYKRFLAVLAALKNY